MVSFIFCLLENASCIIFVFNLCFLGMSFTVQDLHLLKGVLNYIADTRKSLRKEKEMKDTLEIRPPGLLQRSL